MLLSPIASGRGARFGAGVKDDEDDCDEDGEDGEHALISEIATSTMNPRAITTAPSFHAASTGIPYCAKARSCVTTV